MECFFKVLGKYADFSGRAQRKEFWMFMLFYVALGIDAIVIEALLAGGINNDIPISLVVYLIAMILPSLAVTVRRLHDTGKSGWWILVRLIPVAGNIGLFIWLFKDSQKDSNRYGDNPKTTPQQAPSEKAQLTGAGITLIFVSVFFLITDIVNLSAINANANTALFVGVIISTIMHLLFLFTGVLLLTPDNPYTLPVEGAKRKIFVPLLIYGVIMTIVYMVGFIYLVSTFLRGFVAIAFFLTIVLQSAAIVFFASVLNSSKELLKTASIILMTLSGIMITLSILMVISISQAFRYIDLPDSFVTLIIVIPLFSISLILLARIFKSSGKETDDDFAGKAYLGGNSRRIYGGGIQQQPATQPTTVTGGYTGKYAGVPQQPPAVQLPTGDDRAGTTNFERDSSVNNNDFKLEKSAAAVPSAAGDATKVKFVREDRDNTTVWRVYGASCKADALAFLSEQTVSRPLFYLVVETPDGNFGKDKDGIYQE
jgi:uncharacterized membrane protein YhaH (DUF805 family)